MPKTKLVIKVSDISPYIISKFLFLIPFNQPRSLDEEYLKMLYFFFFFSSASTRWEPIKPPAPVTSIFSIIHSFISIY